MRHLTFVFTALLTVGLAIVVAGTATDALAQTASTTAQTTTKTLTTTTAQTETLEETAENAIEEIKKRIEKNTQMVKGAISSALGRSHGVIGEVLRINDGVLTFKNQQGTTILPISESEVVINKKDTITPLTDIAVGEWVTVLGYRTGDTFTPRFISVSETSLRPKTQVVLLGIIEEISSRSIVIRDRATGELKTFSSSKTSKFEDVDGEKAAVTDFDVDVNVLAIGFDDEDTEYELTTLRSLAPLE